jgi:transcriptional regulator with XRE-family HTH domain
MTGYHTRWARPEAQDDDLERIAICEALAFGKALHDRRVALGLSVADLALRAEMTAGEIECIEEGGTEPTVALLRRLAAALGRRRAPHRRPRPRLLVVRDSRGLTSPGRVLPAGHETLPASRVIARQRRRRQLAAERDVPTPGRARVSAVRFAARQERSRSHDRA